LLIFWPAHAAATFSIFANSVLERLSAACLNPLVKQRLPGYKCAALAEDRSLAFLRRGWINFDLVWTATMIVCGIVLLAI